MASSMMAMSCGDRAMGPAESNSGEMGTMPVDGIKPWVGFIAYTSFLEDGVKMDPDVSVPVDTGAKPAATPAHDPDEDPPTACFPCV